MFAQTTKAKTQIKTKRRVRTAGRTLRLRMTATSGMTTNTQLYPIKEIIPHTNCMVLTT